MNQNNLTNSKAWQILSQDEQASLQLTIAYNKSSWQAGEILNKSHYKYLEIKLRAEKFIQMFVSHYNKYGNLVPDELFVPIHFREFLLEVIERRKSPKEASMIMEDTRYKKSKVREKLIISNLKILKESSDPRAIDLFNLIMDFDRWNNFRILPVEIQEPSAFPRRNKTRIRRHIQDMVGLSKFSLYSIIKEYSYSGSKEGYFMPLIADSEPMGYKIIKMKLDERLVLDASKRVSMYIFEKESDAIELAILINAYMRKGFKKNPSNGLAFWAKFRTVAQRSVNYFYMERISSVRPYLDKAFIDPMDEKIKERPGRAKINIFFDK